MFSTIKLYIIIPLLAMVGFFSLRAKHLSSELQETKQQLRVNKELNLAKIKVARAKLKAHTALALVKESRIKLKEVQAKQSAQDLVKNPVIKIEETGEDITV